MHTKYRLTLFIPSHHSSASEADFKFAANAKNVHSTHTHRVWKHHSKMGFFRLMRE